MPDYKKLYYKNFNEITDAERLIERALIILKTTQQKCEDVVIEADDTPISLVPPTDGDA